MRDKILAVLAVIMLVIISVAVWQRHHTSLTVITDDLGRYLPSPDMVDYMTKYGHGLRFGEESMD